MAQRLSVAAWTLAAAEGAVTGARSRDDVDRCAIALCVGPADDHSHWTMLRLSRRRAAGSKFQSRRADDRHGGLGRTRLERLDQLKDLEELLVEETQVDMIRSELLSFIFQLEVFEEIPGIGIAFGALLNLSFMHRVDVTARRVFRERWLKDNGKSRGIEPAVDSPREIAAGFAGIAGRAGYSACYCAVFGIALPVFAVASLVA